jgi:hypothetical protein
MSPSNVSAASASAASQLVQSLGQHKHGRHKSQSISDVRAQNSGGTSAASSAGKAGSKVDITA